MLRDMHIGDEIREARKKIGWTQEKLAAAVGVNKSAVAQWESPNSRSGITSDNLLRVAGLLQLRLDNYTGVDAEDGVKVELVDPKEIALVSLYRRLSGRLQDIYLALFYEAVGSPRDEKAIITSAPASKRRQRKG